jgi:hypothetical protein
VARPNLCCAVQTSLSDARRGSLRVVEHHHRCLYCVALWVCDENCPFAGPSVCAECREKLRTSPGMTRRVVPRTDVRVLARLADDAGARLRDLLRRRPL